MNQRRTASQATPHTSFYPSAYMTVPLHYPEANIYGAPAATWGQIDTQYIHTVEGDSGNDKEKEERCVVWDGTGSL